jgi:hypothetical protein
MTDQSLTLDEAIKSGRLRDFIVQKEARGIGPMIGRSVGWRSCESSRLYRIAAEMAHPETDFQDAVDVYVVARKLRKEVLNRKRSNGAWFVAAEAV